MGCSMAEAPVRFAALEGHAIDGIKGKTAGRRSRTFSIDRNRGRDARAPSTRAQHSAPCRGMDFRYSAARALLRPSRMRSGRIFRRVLTTSPTLTKVLRFLFVGKDYTALDCAATRFNFRDVCYLTGYPKVVWRQSKVRFLSVFRREVSS